MEIYVVEPGDTVDNIAGSFGIDVNKLIYDNQLVYPYQLAIGQALLILDNGRNPSRSIFAGGYAYPFINREVLQETLPFLSELPIFSYGFTAEGQLIPPLWDDTWMIDEAENFGTDAILTLTPFGADGQFNNYLISAIVNNASATQNLINNLITLMREKRYHGIDIDFEYILAQDRDAFTAFVFNIAQAMRQQGYSTSVALAPKTSANQTGLLYEGKDYRAIGEAADYVLLMTYEWGYT